MEQDELIKDIIVCLCELNDDNSVPRNVKMKVAGAIKMLEDTGEVSIRVNKALHQLDEIAEDSNMEPFTRTQIWNVVSQLERI
ncbi:MAG: UPF0147 family protein [Candidatus Woesearchaeota archaeon]